MPRKRTISRYRAYAVLIVVLISLLIIQNYYDYQHKFFQWAYPNNHAKMFTHIYKNGHWYRSYNVSSNPEYIQDYIQLLQQYFKAPEYKTIVDFGCGDWRFMRYIEIPDDKTYICYEIVPDLVANNTDKYGKKNILFFYSPDLITFSQKDIKADLLIIKNVMQHWPNKDIKFFMDNIASKYPQALITNMYSEESMQVNKDIKLGDKRPIDLTKRPFSYTRLEPLLDFEVISSKVFLFKNPAAK